MAIIFEEDMSPKRMTKEKWIELGVKYLEKKERGWSALQFAKEYNLKHATMSRAFRKFREEIREQYEIERKKPKKRSKPTSKKKDLINQFREALRAKSKDSNASNNNKSVKWFKEKIKESLRTKQTTRPIPGKMYTFVYDAKLKDTLPYWDKFPLILYLGVKVTKDGRKLFTGINLHYIPPKARQEFMEELLPYASTKNLSANTKLKINWDTVKSMRGSDLMIKTYLPSHLKTSMNEIKPTDWPNAIYMPTQQFMSKGKRFGARQVWSRY